jgi:hypothetical protein
VVVVVLVVVIVVVVVVVAVAVVVVVLVVVVVVHINRIIVSIISGWIHSEMHSKPLATLVDLEAFRHIPLAS